MRVEIVNVVLQHPDFDGDAAAVGQLMDRGEMGLFLERYGKFLGKIQLRWIQETWADDWEVQHWCERLLDDGESDRSLAKNRRLRFLELNEEGYFDPSEMRRRDPAGWEYFVGQAAKAAGDKVPPQDEEEGGMGLGGFMLRAMNKQQMRYVEAVQMHADVAMEKLMEYERKAEGEEEQDPLELMEIWRRIHRARFLAGEDETFDYGEVDSNDKYDNVKVTQLDDEEKWFDAD